jgi:multidrug efflux pump subunit AcrA (membrane-fusion protein)
MLTVGVRADTKKPTLIDIPVQQDGVVLVIGTPLSEKPSSKAEPVVTIDGDDKRTFRPLKVGDLVEKGQLVAQLDDRLVRRELAVKDQQVKVCQAELDAANKTAEEAYSHFFAYVNEHYKNAKVFGPVSEEPRRLRLAYDKQRAEATVKKEQLALTKLELKKLATIVEMYEVHSPARGIIRKLYKQPGEAVKSLEPLLQIEIVESKEAQ